jgi:threonine dehydrogenase-like Zn-dependent dehydrogenase
LPAESAHAIKAAIDEALGAADPLKVITHTMSLDEAPHGYDIFTNRKDNCIKVLLKPHG